MIYLPKTIMTAKAKIHLVEAHDDIGKALCGYSGKLGDSPWAIMSAPADCQKCLDRLELINENDWNGGYGTIDRTV